MPAIAPRTPRGGPPATPGMRDRARVPARAPEPAGGRSPRAAYGVRNAASRRAPLPPRGRVDAQGAALLEDLDEGGHAPCALLVLPALECPLADPVARPRGAVRSR